MKNLFLLVLITGLSSIFNNAQSNLWTDISESRITLVGERRIIPEVYRTLELNLTEAKSLLNSAPMEFTSEINKDRSVIELPMPDGTFQRFKFWESPTMAPELQSQYPEIRTYTGQGIDDPYATLKFDLTPHGFHAQILSPGGRVFIDPHNNGDVEHYISYYAKDFKKSDTQWECQLLFDEHSPNEINNSTDKVLTPSGPQLRTYRLAVAATGEYTAFHGGTVALGLAAVVTSVNRVNGVYEKEVAVRMVLVANNNLIIYTASGSDPYNNGNGSQMLTQNINNLSTVIGNSNFDIGHVFSTGGGGVAYLGCVCTSSKAGGVTGSSSPVGDPFDIDYVAHEMGHQFGANHTFNGNTGSCNGNRNSTTAFEPGSGSTIMAYAGICSPQDLQGNSDAFFHVASFDEIIAYTNSGSGNGCAVITNTSNNAPVVTVPAGGFAIPKSTPFSLTGSATDPNGDALTYCWEEYDLGPAGAPGSPSGDAPILRSFSPSTSSTRIFPKLTDLLNNTTTIGELLPTYARNLKFRMTVRDNRAGGGGVDWKQINFTVDGNSGPFVVTSPNTNVSWTGNTSQTITWNAANTTASPVNCSNVKILLSTDGGNTFPTVLIASTPNDGSELITLPNLPSTQARIKVEAVGNIFFDISNVNFTIINSPVASDPVTFTANAIGSSQINLTFTPNASNNNVVIVWNNTGTFTAPTGTPPSAGSAFAGGTLLYNGISSPQIHSGLTSTSNYFYKAFSYNGTSYSPGLTSFTSTFSIENPTSFTSTPVSSTEIYVAFTPNIVNNNVVIVWNSSESFSIPVGTPPSVGQPFAGGILLYNGLTSPQLHSALTQGTDYYYKAFSYDGVNYSFGINTEATTLNPPSTFQHTQAVTNGWNMVSIPGLMPPGGTQNPIQWWNSIDPGSSVFQYNGGYSPASTLVPTQGYWMKHIGNKTYNTGEEWPAGGINIVPHEPINFSGGWGLIGVYECPVPVSSITTIPAGLLVGFVYGYFSGYQSVDTLYPGYAYWIKLSGSGSIILPPCNMAGPVIKTVELIDKNWGRIIFSDNSGKSYMLYLTKNESSSDGINLNDYELPPIPPEGMFDIRFTSGQLVEDISSGIKSINMQGIEYPVKVRVENVEITIQDATGSGLNVSLKSGEEITINNRQINKLLVSEDVIPDKYSLEQNYPNPFNPATVIKFSVPKQSQLKINLYNTLGELVQVIAEGFYEAGSYQVELNVNNLPSGIYVYRMESSESTLSKKMILIK